MLRESAILAQVGEKNLERGREYVKRHAIINPKQQGTRLKALCQGSLPEPYLLWVRLSGEAVEAAGCACPVGGDGQCKHVAALLLLYRSTPAVFTVLLETDAALERRSKEELIALLKQAFEVEPRLENLFEIVLRPAQLPTDEEEA